MSLTQEEKDDAIWPDEKETLFLTVLYERVKKDPTGNPTFKKCVGAIDGTHVAASAPASKQKTFRGRHATVTQNVMAACSHDMLFTYVYAGWEGTGNDSRVFLDA
ncbi:unnamed protein product, partial [Cuscuta epithymum]